MYRISAMDLVGLAQAEEGVLISWIPDGLRIELSRPRLESLRDQYEQQLATLRHQLEAEQASKPGEEQAAPPVVSPETPPSATEIPVGMATNGQVAGGGIGGVGDAGSHGNRSFAFTSTFLQDMDALREDLDTDQHEVFDALRDSIRELHAKNVDAMREAHKADLELQLQAMKLTVSQVYAGQLKLTMADVGHRTGQGVGQTGDQGTETHRQDSLNSQDSLESGPRGDCHSPSRGVTADDVDLCLLDAWEPTSDNDSAHTQEEIVKLRAKLQKQTLDSELTLTALRHSHKVELESLTTCATCSGRHAPITNGDGVDKDGFQVECNGSARNHVPYSATDDRRIQQLEEQLTSYKLQLATIKMETEETYQGLVDKHERELMEKEITLQQSHSEEMKRVEERLRKEADEALVELRKALEEKQAEAQEKAMKDYEATMMKKYKAEVESLETTLHDHYQEEIESLEEKFMEQQKTIIELQHKVKEEEGGSPARHNGKSLLEEVTRLRSELCIRDEEKANLKRDIADKHRQDMEKIIASLMEKHEVEIEELKESISVYEKEKGKQSPGGSDEVPLEELTSQLNAKQFEDMENLKNDLNRKHELDKEEIKERYEKRLQSMTDSIGSRIEQEVQRVREETDSLMEKELDAARDYVRETLEEDFKERERQWEISRLELKRKYDEELEVLRDTESFESPRGEQFLRSSSLDEIQELVKEELKKEFDTKLSESLAKQREEMKLEFKEKMAEWENAKTVIVSTEGEDARDEQEEREEIMASELTELRVQVEAKSRLLAQLEEQLEAYKTRPSTDRSQSGEDVKIEGGDNGSTISPEERMTIMQSKMIELEQIVDNLEKQKTKQEDTIEEYEEKIIDLEGDIAEYKRKQAALEKKQQFQERQLAELQAMGDGFDQERQELFERLDEYEKRIGDTDKEKRQDASRIHDLEDMLVHQTEDLQGKLNKAEEKLKSYELQVSYLEEKLSRSVDSAAVVEEPQIARTCSLGDDDSIPECLSYQDSDESQGSGGDRSAAEEGALSRTFTRESDSSAGDDMDRSDMKAKVTYQDSFESVSPIDGSISDSSSRQDPKDQQVDEFRKQVSALESRIQECETMIEERDAVRIRDSERIQTLQSELQEVRNAYQDLEDDLEIKVASYEASLLEITTAPATSPRDTIVNDPSDNIEAYKSRISDLESKVWDYEELIEERDATRVRDAERIETLRCELKELQNAFQDLEDDLDSRVDSYESAIKALQDTVASSPRDGDCAQDTEVNALRQQLLELQEQMESFRKGVRQGTAAEVVSLKDELLQGAAEEAAAARGDLEARLQQLTDSLHQQQASHRDQLGRAMAEHRTEIEDLTEEHNGVVEGLKDQHRAELEERRADTGDQPVNGRGGSGSSEDFPAAVTPGDSAHSAAEPESGEVGDSTADSFTGSDIPEVMEVDSASVASERSEAGEDASSPRHVVASDHHGDVAVSATPGSTSTDAADYLEEIAAGGDPSSDPEGMDEDGGEDRRLSGAEADESEGNLIGWDTSEIEPITIRPVGIKPSTEGDEGDSQKKHAPEKGDDGAADESEEEEEEDEENEDDEDGDDEEDEDDERDLVQEYKEHLERLDSYRYEDSSDEAPDEENEEEEESDAQEGEYVLDTIVPMGRRGHLTQTIREESEPKEDDPGRGVDAPERVEDIIPAKEKETPSDWLVFHDVTGEQDAEEDGVFYEASPPQRKAPPVVQVVPPQTLITILDTSPSREDASSSGSSDAEDGGIPEIKVTQASPALSTPEPGDPEPMFPVHDVSQTQSDISSGSQPAEKDVSGVGLPGEEAEAVTPVSGSDTPVESDPDVSQKFTFEVNTLDRSRLVQDTSREEISGASSVELEAIQKYQEELEKLKSSNLEQLENVQVAIKEDLLRDNMKKLEAMTNDLEKSHRVEVREVTLKYEEQVQLLEEQLTSQHREWQLKHEAELARLRAQYELRLAQEVQAQHQHLDADHLDQLDAARLDTERAKLDLDSAHRQELQDLVDQYQRQIAAMEQARSKNSDAIPDSDEEMRALQSQLTRMKDGYNQGQEDMSELRKEVDRLREELNEFSDKKTELGKLKAEIERLNDAAKEDSRKAEEENQLLLKLREENASYEQRLKDYELKSNSAGKVVDEDLVPSLSVEEVNASQSLSVSSTSTTSTVTQSLITASTIMEREEKIAELEKVVSDLEEQKESWCRDQDKIRELEQLKEALTANQAQCVELQEKLQATESERETWTGVKEKLQDLEKEKEAWHNDRQKLETLQRERDTLTEEVDQLEKDLEDERAKSSQMEAVTKEALAGQKATLEQEIAALRLSLEQVTLETDSPEHASHKERIAEQTVAMERMKEQFSEETNTKSEQLERLSVEIMNQNQEIDKYKEKVSGLESQITELQSRHEVTLGRREREHAEGDNLVAMLRADLDRLGTERDTVQQTNDQLLKLVSDSVKINLSTEERINRRLISLVTEGQRGFSASGNGATPVSQRGSTPRRGSGVGAENRGVPRPPTPSRGGGVSPDEGEPALQDTSVVSVFSDEGLDLSQRISESIFAGPDLDPDSEEVVRVDTKSHVADSGQRLQLSVDRLLDMIQEVTGQIQDAQTAQRALLETLSGRNQDLEALSERCEDLERELRTEVEAKDVLALELTKAEGLVLGYQEERGQLDESLRHLEDTRESLAGEVERLRLRLDELEDAQGGMAAREDDLQRQRDALERSLGAQEQVLEEVSVASAPASSVHVPVADCDSDSINNNSKPELLRENSKLTEEKRDLQKQCDTERELFQGHMRELQQTVEEAQLTHDQTLEATRAETEDLQKQMEALEKQLKSNKHFLQDQTTEREQEREDFQKEIDDLKKIIKEKEKVQSTEKRLLNEAGEPESDDELSQLRRSQESQRTQINLLRVEVQELEEQLSEKTESLRELLERKEQLERDLQGHETSSAELRDVIRQLEIELEARFRSENELKKAIEEVQAELDKLQELNSELNAALKDGGLSLSGHASQRLLNDLEAQVQTLKDSEQTAWKKVKELEEQLKNMKTVEEELTEDKKALQEQVMGHLKQISSLKCQVDGLKLGATSASAGQAQAEAGQISELKRLLEEEREAVESTQKEMEALAEELSDIRQRAGSQDMEVHQRAAQLEAAHEEQRASRDQLQQEVDRLQQSNDQLKAQVETLKEQAGSSSMPVFAQNLIDVKNDEIDHLNSAIARLKDELLTAHMGDVGREQINQLCLEIETKNLELESRAAEILDMKRTIQNMRESESVLRDVAEGELQDAEVLEGAMQRRDSVADLRRRLEQLQTELDTVQQERQQEVEILKAQLQHKERELQCVEDQEGQRQQEATPTGSPLRERDDVIRRLTAEVEQLTAARSQMQDRDDTIRELTEVVEQLRATQGDVTARDDVIKQLNKQVDELRAAETGVQERDDVIKQLNARVEQLRAAERGVQERDDVIGDLSAQVEALQRQLEGLTAAQTGLQEDFDTVQAMLDTKQRELESQTRDLDEARRSDLVVRDLQKDLQEKDNVIEEKEEELYTLNERIEKQAEVQEELSGAKERLEREQESSKAEVENLRRQLSVLLAKTSEESPPAAQIGAGDSAVLQIQIQSQERLIGELKHQLHEAETSKKALHEELNAALSKLHSLEGALRDAEQSYSLEVDDLKSRVTLTRSRDTDSAVEEKLEELRQQLHAENQRNIKEAMLSESRHLQEIHGKDMTALKTRLASEKTQDVDEMRVALETSHAQQMAELRTRLETERRQGIRDVTEAWEKRHAETVNRMIADHLREMERLQLLSLDISDNESLSDVTRRLQHEVEQNAQLDVPQWAPTRQREEGVGGPALANGYSPSDTQVADSLQAIVNKVCTEGLSVLSLSELQFLRSLGGPGPLPSQGASPAASPRTQPQMSSAVERAWREEKRSMLSAIQALKDLLAETQKSRNPSKLVNLLTDFMTDPEIWVLSQYDTDDAAGCDWRADVLKAVHNVFAQETDAARSQTHTFKVINGQATVAPSVDSLENQLDDMKSHQKMALQQIHAADRQSLLAEIRDLQKQLADVKDESQQSTTRFSDQLSFIEEQYAKREGQLKRQGELLEYKVQQERILAEDLRSSLDLEKSRSLELSSQLSREKASSHQLQEEIANTQTQLRKLQDALEREQSHLVSASSALEEERGRSGQLGEALTREHTQREQCSLHLDTERQRHQQLKEHTNQVIQKLKLDLEQEKEVTLEKTKLHEKERLHSDQLRRELDKSRELSRAADAKYKNKASELRTLVDMEKARCNELNSALQRERHLVAQLRDALQDERGSQHEVEQRERETISDLQSNLDLERSKVFELQTAVERERQKGAALVAQLESEKSLLKDELEQEKVNIRELRGETNSLQAEKLELARELEFAGERVASVCADRDRVEAGLQATRDRLKEAHGQLEAVQQTERRRQRHRDLQQQDQDRQRAAQQDSEMHRLRQKVGDLELQLAETRHNEIQAREERDLERLRTAMTPPRSHRPDPSSRRSLASRVTIDHNGAGTSPATLQRRQLESLRQRLHLLVIRHQEEVARSFSTGESGRQSLSDSGLQSIVQALKDILNELHTLQQILASDSVDDIATLTNHVPGLNDRILRHNAELTAFVSKLSDEKHELRRTLSTLEEEVWNYRQKEALWVKSEADEDRQNTEKATWSRERAKLVLQLHESESELSRVRDDLRRAEIDLEREREKYFKPYTDPQGAADKEKMQRLYGRYLRAESFRKALVYQKKYLLLLLGGFQDCEQETLATIARMGGHPDPGVLIQTATARARPYNRFRSAVRVVIAVSRLKFLVRKWRRAVRVGTPVVAGSPGPEPGASYIPPTNGVTSSVTSRDSTRTRPTSAGHVNGAASADWSAGDHPHHHHRPRHQPRPRTPESRGGAGRENRDPDPAAQGGRVGGSERRSARGPGLGYTPPTRDLGDLRRHLDTEVSASDRLAGATARGQHVAAPQAKRQILSALDPAHESPARPPPPRPLRASPLGPMPPPTTPPLATPAPSLSTGTAANNSFSTDPEADEALNDYMQRLENLQARLGTAVNRRTTRSQWGSRR